MFYYKVFVNDISYKGNDPLTYHATKRLAIGSIVIVPLKSKLVAGFVSEIVKKPEFNTRPIDQVLELPPLPHPIVDLASWLQLYYPSSIGSVTQHFLPRSLLNLHTDTTENTPVDTPDLPPLTSNQQKAIRTISQPDTYILHGDTGSGKTRVYIELAIKTLRNGRSVIILVPEIGLTPQLTQEFQKSFGSDNIIVTHSQLTEKERRDRWGQALTSTKPVIVIGPRSALFTPLKDVGLIVADEFHETSYKQDQSPHYNAIRVASQLAKLHQATLVLGSATPSVTDYFVAEQKQKTIIRMTGAAQANGDIADNLQIIDLKNRSNFNRSQYLSDELIASIEAALASNEQSLLFLNRRGTARVVLCDKCGWQALCPHCNLPLTYHGDLHILRCHTCGHTESAVSSCPECGNPDVVLKSIGTKAIYDEVGKLFPQAKIQRFDTDNKKSERIEQHFNAVTSGSLDILIGTQLLVKGFDLPKLSVVGVVIADTSLSFPDYSAEERTYQLLRQAIGRVGRGHRNSTVILQTYDPSSPLIRSISENRWHDFYMNELDQRKKFKFPPFYFMLKLTVRRATTSSSQNAAQKFVDLLHTKHIPIIVDGPAPSLHERIGSKYQWQIVIKARSRNELLKVIGLIPPGWSYDIDPINLL